MQIGSLVECTYTFPPTEVTPVAPVKGAIYTVRGITEHDGNTGITLEEIVNPPTNTNAGFSEVHFWDKWFQEIQGPNEVNLSEIMEEANLVPFYIGMGY